MDVAQNTDQNANPVEIQPSPDSETKPKNFERSSTGVSNSLTSANRTDIKMKKTSSVKRSESVQEKIKKFSMKDETVPVPVFKKPTFVIPKIVENPKVDDNNNKAVRFVPMAERIQEYEEELNDELVLSKLQDVVRSRREMFASPNSTLERPPNVRQRKQKMGNGSLVKHVLIKQRNSFNSSSNPVDIQRKIEEIEREIRENETRMEQMAPAPVVETLNRPQAAKVTKNDSFLSRLKPKSEAPLVEKRSTEKLHVLQQLGLPLSENHDVECYLSQFSLEGEFV